MDFARVLNQSFQENAPKQSDATKQILEQGENFQKTMAGERGIMAAIESAHLRPKIQKYLQSKLNTIKPDDVLENARNIGTRLTGRPATREEIAGPRAPPPPVTENKVMAPSASETGLIQEGGFQSLAPGRGIEERFGREPTPSIEASRLTENVDPLSNPYNPRNIENVGQSERVPQLDTPETLPGLRGPAAVSREALESVPSARIPATTSEQIARLGQSIAEKSALPDIPEEEAARSGALLGAGGQRPTIRTGTEESSLPAAPSLLQEPTEEDENIAQQQVEAQAKGVSRAAEQVRAIPKPAPEPAQAGTGTRAPEPTPEDFPSVPKTTLPSAIGSETEEGASLLSSLGSGFKSVVGATGTLGEGLGVISAFTQKGLSGNQRLSQVAQTVAPRVAGTALDEFGLPKAAGAAAGAAGDEAAAAAAAAAKAAAKATAEKIAGQAGKTAAVGSEEAAVPGIGDILAIGTALFGAIRAGVEAGKAKREAEDYVAPAAPRVAMDNAVSFDSSFR
tara:strand:+ start:848 stop:2377 length:1530 start_codon:yes stop_codon:yes gene_type:complete